MLPLRNRAKVAPPKGFTGYAGIDPSYPDIMAWCDDYPDGNLCLRLPDGIIGIDVDAYGVKTGEQALREAERRFGPLPNTVRSGSRELDEHSGIRLYRVPTGTVLEADIHFPELGIGDIEIVQRHHRYVLAWPSLHPEGREYWWRDHNLKIVGIPAPDSLPWLPQRWIEGLRITPRSLDLNVSAYDVRQALTTGEQSIAVADRLSQAIKELNLPGQSRHDTCCRHVLALLRLGKSGESGVGRAMHLLSEVFVSVSTLDESRTPDEARSEFERFITNNNAARELAQPGLLDWMRSIVAEAQEEVAQTIAPASFSEVATAPVPSAPVRRHELESLEAGFWDSRESLRIIWQTSMARLSPPWSVLAFCAARALTQVRPHVTLPPLIGGPGSLNWFAALVADSSGGKTTSAMAAEFLVPAHIEEANAGSGEGIVAMFGRPQDEGDPLPEREALMFVIDEVDTLSALSGRSASTTLPILRSAFSGSTLGFSYAAKEKRRHIGRGRYRMTLVMGVQPTRAGWLLADEGGGTPQRFMWFPAKDSRISKKRPWDAGPLQLPAAGEWLYPREIKLPPEAEELIIDEQVKRQQGEVRALDGHSLFCREKFAYALTVLDGRVEMNSEDWELSGIAAEVSNHTRCKVVDAVREAARVDALDRGEIRGVEMAAADAEKQYEQAEAVRSALRWCLGKIRDAGDEGIGNRELSQAASKRNRRYLQSALSLGASNGLVKMLEGTTTWVVL